MTQVEMDQEFLQLLAAVRQSLDIQPVVRSPMTVIIEGGEVFEVSDPAAIVALCAQLPAFAVYGSAANARAGRAPLIRWRRAADGPSWAGAVAVGVPGAPAPAAAAWAAWTRGADAVPRPVEATRAALRRAGRPPARLRDAAVALLRPPPSSAGADSHSLGAARALLEQHGSQALAAIVEEAGPTLLAFDLAQDDYTVILVLLIALGAASATTPEAGG